MSESESSRSAERELTIDSLAGVRGQTDAIAGLLRRRLAAQLEVLRPVFAPRRVLGRHVRAGSRDEVPGAERAFAALAERYALTCGAPFSLPKEIGEEPLAIEGILEPFPYEYRHRVDPDAPRSVTVTSPVCWTLNYRCGYTLSELESALLQRATLRPADARQFVINALALQLLLETFPETVRLLEELRYDVRIERRPELGSLPLVTLRAPLAAFRPSDEVIATATRFSGVPAFIELIDVAALRTLRDPLRDEIEAALAP